jgi:hypothetical protein
VKSRASTSRYAVRRSHPLNATGGREANSGDVKEPYLYSFIRFALRWSAGMSIRRLRVTYLKKYDWTSTTTYYYESTEYYSALRTTSIQVEQGGSVGAEQTHTKKLSSFLNKPPLNLNVVKAVRLMQSGSACCGKTPCLLGMCHAGVRSRHHFLIRVLTLIWCKLLVCNYSL